MADTPICVHWSFHDAAIDGPEHSGHLCLFPGQDLEESLWEAIEEQKLQAALQAEFQITHPLWYGFWIDSPLSQRQSRVLNRLLLEVARQSFLRRRELGSFLVFLRQASDGKGTFSVRLSPPGHTDFGWTTFAHCPRCKAEAPFPRWREYPSELIACPVCQHEYRPAETYSNVEDWSPGSETEQSSREVGCLFIGWMLGWNLIEAVFTSWVKMIERGQRRRRRAKREKQRK